MKLSQTTQFKKDIKRQVRQGKDQKKLIVDVHVFPFGEVRHVNAFHELNALIGLSYEERYEAPAGL